MGPPRKVPTLEEAQNIKRRCAVMLLRLLPHPVATVYFARLPGETILTQVEELLDCLGDSYLNKHFIFQIVEVIVLRLVPELGEKGVKELLDERLS